MDSPAPSRRPVLAIFQHFLHFLGAALAALAVAMIPRFVTFYHEAIDSKSLPPLALFLWRWQPLWVVLAIIFALAAFYGLWRWRLRPVPGGISLALLLLPAALAIGLFICLMQLIPSTMVIVQGNPTSVATQLETEK